MSMVPWELKYIFKWICNVLVVWYSNWTYLTCYMVPGLSIVMHLLLFVWLLVLWIFFMLRLLRGILLGSYYKILGHLTSIFFVHYRLEDWRSTWRGSMPLSTGCLTSLVVHLYVCHVKLLNFLILSFLFSTSQLLLLTHYNSLGLQAPKPSSGPHKSRECLPLILVLRNRLKYALTYREVIAILMQRHVLVDGKVRTDKTYPAGFMGMWTSLFASNLIFFFFFWKWYSVILILDLLVI